MRRPLGLGALLSSRRAAVIESAWLIGSQAIFAISTLLGVRLLSELMPPAAYGEVALLIGIQTLGRNLFTYSFRGAAIRFYPEVSGRGEVGILKRLILISLNRSTALLAIVIILVGTASYGWKPMSLLQLPLMIGLLFVDNLRGLESDLLVAARRQRAFAIIWASESCLRAVGAVLMVRWLGPTPAMVLLGYLLGGTAVYAGLFLFRVERIGVAERTAAIGPTEPLVRALRDRIWRFSLPMIPIAIMDWISGLSDRYLVGGLVGLEAAGIYVAAYGLMNQPFGIVQTTLELILRSRYFEAVSAGDAERARKVFVSWVTVQVAISIVGVVMVAILSKTIASICLGERFQVASKIMPLIASGNAISALYATLEKVFHARQNTGWCVALRAVGAVVSVAVGLPLILAFGIVGAASAVPIYYGLQTLTCIVVIRSTSRPGPVGTRGPMTL